jgi:hypothetical protein
MNNVVQGLKELGKGNINDNAKVKIKKALKKMSLENIEEDS